MQSQAHLNVASNNWRAIGLVILCIRFVQGWIFWGGGSRRFIYDPYKLDPYAPQWMANKVQSAMPGMLFDLSPVVSFLLQHFVLLYISIIIFSLLELISGLALIFGFFTRAAALLTAFISVILMILFGWQGSTCMDEWTMAVSNLSIGLTLVLSGSMAYSIDAWLMKKRPEMINKKWFMLLGSAPWSFPTLKKVAIWFFVVTAIFTVGTYDYYRGAVFTPYHAGPVNPNVFHLSLSNAKLLPDDEIQFKMYVDAGPDAVPMYLVRIELRDENNALIEAWPGTELQKLPKQAIQNSYAYNQVRVGQYGLIAPESAEAIIRLNSSKKLNPQKEYQLQVYSVDGRRWDLDLNKRDSSDL
ncbi:TQO small subunit DoxD [Legionella impletisoli]|uniref:Quinol oxidase n=1 Tax=Legionella impletisoli TaxID=343510 RepID=A0A917JPC3_9GAMM|nr:TQO small subunit DoxD [Legionella impletisoli]GGI78136.1 quinol oxidase [Legionella impletisoli]